MWPVLRGAVAGAAACSFLSGCASLNLIHDPEFGALSQEEVIPLLKSLRCEMLTFYDANRQRMKVYTDLTQYYRANRKAKPAAAEDAFREAQLFSHFVLSDELYGEASLDLKVLDVLGSVGSGSSLDYKRSYAKSTSSFDWHVGPSLNTQNTYDKTWVFLIDQGASMYPPKEAATDPLRCYSQIPPSETVPKTPTVPSPQDYDGLAAGKYPQYQLFERIKVDLTKPLAEWLQDDSAQMWTSFHQNAPDKDQSLFPVQQTFSFAVQIGAGIEAKYALVSTRWSPFAPDLTASLQQTGTLTFVLNGPDAVLANSAKTGNATNARYSGNGTYVPVPYDNKLQEFNFKFKTPPNNTGLKGSNGGGLLYPAVPAIPTPGQ